MVPPSKIGRHIEMSRRGKYRPCRPANPQPHALRQRSACKTQNENSKRCGNFTVGDGKESETAVRQKKAILLATCPALLRFRCHFTMRFSHIHVLRSGLLINAHQPLAMTYEALRLLPIKTFSRFVLGKHLFMLVRLCPHFFGCIFIMLCQSLMIAARCGALYSPSHVHRMRIYCT